MFCVDGVRIGINIINIPMIIIVVIIVVMIIIPSLHEKEY